MGTDPTPAIHEIPYVIAIQINTELHLSNFNSPITYLFIDSHSNENGTVWCDMELRYSDGLLAWQLRFLPYIVQLDDSFYFHLQTDFIYDTDRSSLANPPFSSFHTSHFYSYSIVSAELGGPTFYTTGTTINPSHPISYTDLTKRWDDYFRLTRSLCPDGVVVTFAPRLSDVNYKSYFYRSYFQPYFQQQLIDQYPQPPEEEEEEEEA